MTHLKTRALPAQDAPAGGVRTQRGRGRGPTDFAWSTALGFGGALVTVAAVMIGAVLAVIFAATLALVTVLASVLLALAALAWRAQPRPALARMGLAKARAGGHAWVAYDWDSPRS